MGIDLEQLSGEHHKEYSRLNVSVGDAGATTSSIIAEYGKENTEPSVTGCTSTSNNVVAGDGVDADSQKNFEPHDGMEFESKEDAFSFYKTYASSVGFATIIKASRRSRISGKFIDAKFVCTRYGRKRESGTFESAEPDSVAHSMSVIPVKKKRGRTNRSWSKTDCKACMHVKRRQDGRWVIRSFIEEHNHEIFPDQADFFRGHQNLDIGNCSVDVLHAIRARTKKMYVTMSRQSGGMKKVENPKSSGNASGQHLALEEGDAQFMLEHFMYMQDENPNFFYALDLNQEQRLRNVLWVEAKSRVDYGNFDDVVFFDTTYIKNEYKLSFAPFIGVNHHSQPLLLGCALIVDESKSTFVWVMQAWVRAMRGQAPKVILTDQDKALKAAVTEVLPNTHHCFCLWHILSRIQEKLGHVSRKHENFISKFNKSILKSCTTEQFEKRWWKMINRFDLRNELWLQSLYDDREQWIPTYMKDVCLAGMSTMQRSENTNSLDKCLHRKTTLKEFIEHYMTILQEKCEEEAKADFETWHKQPGLKSPSPFGKQMVAIYTHTVFKKFQVEVLGVVACHPKKESVNGSTARFKVQDFEENQDFIVMCDENTSDISCSCRLFEYNGFLCRHVLVVLQMSGVHNIPSQYILKRWTKDAKSRETMGPIEAIDSRVHRFSELCRRAFKLGDEGSLSEESYSIAFSALEEGLRRCEHVNQSVLEVNSPSTFALHELDDVTQGNCMGNTNKKTNGPTKGKIEPEAVTIGMNGNWQQMEHSNLRAPAFDCSYGSLESIQRREQLNSRVSTLDVYFGSQQIVQGGQLIGPGRDDYDNGQPSVQGLGQLNSIAPIHDSHYLDHHRLNGLGQLHFQSQTIQSCFNIQDSLHDMDQPNVGCTPLHGMISKHLQSKHLSR